MKKILIIDDDFDLVTLLRELLVIKGFKVAALQDGFLIFNEINRFKPDLILMDYFIPHDRNGDQLCKEIKEVRPDIPIIIVSAMDPKKVEDLCADDFLKKPFEVDELISKIKNLIGAK